MSPTSYLAAPPRCVLLRVGCIVVGYFSSWLITRGFSINAAYGRREKVLESYASIKASAVILYLSHRDWLDPVEPEIRPRAPLIATMRKAIGQNDFSAVTGQLFNALEAVTVPEHPQIGAIKENLAGAGAAGVLMSGSGPTVFALTSDLNSARQLAGRVSLGSGVSVFIAETVAREEE